VNHAVLSAEAVESAVAALLVETSLMRRSAGVDMTVHKGDLLRLCLLLRHCPLVALERCQTLLATVVCVGRDANHDYNLFDYFLELEESSLAEIPEASSSGLEVGWWNEVST
jgi:hypothetical protein